VSHLGRRLSALIDDELSHAERDRVLAHLARCEPCRREAAALRALKQRMLALGEATAAAALTDRLMALAALPGLPRRRSAWPAGSFRLGSMRYRLDGQGVRWPLRGMAVITLVLFGLGVPAAAYVAGGSQRAPGPSVTPGVGLFMVQHAITTTVVPVQPVSAGPTNTPTPVTRPGPGFDEPSGASTAPVRVVSAASPSPSLTAVPSPVDTSPVAVTPARAGDDSFPPGVTARAR
jgi:hypothetical protein